MNEHIEKVSYINIDGKINIKLEKRERDISSRLY